MKCSICGNEVTNDVVFCPICGSKIEKDIIEEVSTAEKPRNAKVWDVFAKLGWGLGLAGLICSWIYTLGLSLAVPALVFSILGKKSFKFANKARGGMIMSIIAIAVNFVATIIWVVIIDSNTGNYSGMLY